MNEFFTAASFLEGHLWMAEVKLRILHLKSGALLIFNRTCVKFLEF